jgi:protein-tyrosine-phosphatase
LERRAWNILFLSTGNSARSILAEAILNHFGKGRFRGYSAGGRPKGEVHPLAIDLLKTLGMPSGGFRSKHRDEFTGPGAPEMDFVFTILDDASGEVCPAGPGDPVTARWGIPDPAAVEGNEMVRKNAFRIAYRQLENRIRLFTNIKTRELDRLSLRKNVNGIGRNRG